MLAGQILLCLEVGMCNNNLGTREVSIPIRFRTRLPNI